MGAIFLKSSFILKQKQISACYYHNGFFRGWAYDPFVSNLELSLYENDILLSKSFTNIEAIPQDLTQTEKPPHENCIFALKVPSTLYDGKNHKLVVKVDGWKLQSDPKPIHINFCYGNVSGNVTYDEVIYHIEIDFKTIPQEPVVLFVYDDMASAPIAQEELCLERNTVDNIAKAFFRYKSQKKLYFKCGGILLENTKKKENSQIVGKITSITKNEISGFIIDVANLDKTLDVYMYIDDMPFRLIKPMQKSESIAKLLKIDYELLNNCFFKIETPQILLDGAKHKVEFICKETSKELDGGVKEVEFKNASIPYEKIVKHIVKPSSAKAIDITKKYDVSIVILNRNGESILRELFESFLRFNTANAEFIIIDHASSDASVQIIKEFASKLPIRVKELEYNDSFSASCNLGASMAHSDKLLFLNNDIIWVQDILPQMLKSLDDENIGFVGVKLIKKDRGWISEVQHLGVRFKLVLNEYFPYEVEPTSKESLNEYVPTILPVVTGAVMLCKKSDFDAIGGFDTDYFYGYEDVEICLRMSRLLGKKSLCRNDLLALHKHGYTRLSGREKNVLNRQEHNTKVLFSSIGLWLKQKAREALFEGDREWSQDALNIAFVVSDRLILDERSDTALIVGVAKALRAYGEHINLSFLSPDYDWHDVYDIDILICTNKEYDLRLLRNEKASITRVLYVQEASEIENFRSLAWYEKYDILASSTPSQKKEIVEFNERNIKELLHLASTQLRVAVLVPALKKEYEDSDYFKMAKLLCNELREHKIKTTVVPIEEWENISMVVDVHIHVYDTFCKKYHFTPKRSSLNILWVLDSVNSIDGALLELYDDIWTLEQIAKKPYFVPKIVNECKAEIEMKRYIMLENFDKVPPVIYPNTYYVSGGLTYPADDERYAKRVEIYISKALKSIYKPYLCKTHDNEIHIAKFTDINEILFNKTNLKKWQEPSRYNIQNLIATMIKKMRD